MNCWCEIEQWTIFKTTKIVLTVLGISTIQQLTMIFKTLWSEIIILLCYETQH